MFCRTATFEDAPVIAALHAESWRHAYRGILRNEYLDGDIFRDRTTVWMQRLSAPPPNQTVLLAVENQQVVGFVCICGGESEKWGSLIDNLHVSRAMKGKGIGTELMRAAAIWIRDTYPGAGMYLWVYEANEAARHFYERLGASNAESIVKENPGGGHANSFRYVWPSNNMPDQLSARTF